MLRVAITGGLCSGKSLIAGWFRQWGWPVVDADRMGHTLLESGQPAAQAVVAALGKSILNKRGNIDRGKLADRVFAPKEGDARKALNRILHPRILEAMEEEFVRAEQRGCAVAAAEAALIIEANIQNRFDVVILVVCEDEQRIHRYRTRSDGTRDQAQARLALQWPDVEKMRSADYVIDNSGSVADTRRQAEEIFRKIGSRT